jgi:glycosyltransferase involved in cell wall biosynthesis
MPEPLISVIIPCYNQGHFLAPAIDSILAQNYPHTEIIIVNDGSTDQNTNQIISALAHKRGRGGWETDRPSLKIFTIKNRGSAGARNYGLNKSTGDFIQFLDADDQLLPKKFTHQLKHFSQNPHLDVSYTKFYYRQAKKNIYPAINTIKMNHPLKDLLLKWETSLAIPPICFLFKRHCFHHHRFHESFRMSEDWVLFCELALAGYQFSFINLNGGIYFQHSENKTGNKDKMFYDLVLITAHLRHLIINRHSLLTQFDQAAIARLKYVFYQYFGDELIKNNPDRQELARIKSTLPFKLWQKHGHLFKKLGFKF